MHDFIALECFNVSACNKSHQRFVIFDNKASFIEHEIEVPFESGIILSKCMECGPMYAFIMAYLIIKHHIICTSTSEKLKKPERNGNNFSYAYIHMLYAGDSCGTILTHNIRRYGDSLNNNSLQFHMNFEQFIHRVNQLMKVNNISGPFY